MSEQIGHAPSWPIWSRMALWVGVVQAQLVQNLWSHHCDEVYYHEYAVWFLFKSSVSSTQTEISVSRVPSNKCWIQSTTAFILVGWMCTLQFYFQCQSGSLVVLCCDFCWCTFTTISMSQEPWSQHVSKLETGWPVIILAPRSVLCLMGGKRL